ncbi:MAG TPA: UpxY family transcription antiterminator [Longimicrobium sp.]|nr:UpxY family transcription antiterminator [Longimicrobium sp.]
MTLLRTDRMDGLRTASPLATEPRWYACYTRAKHEKQVIARLESSGIESYLPTVPSTRVWKDRSKTLLWPLFPSYVFGRFTLGDVHRVLTVPGVSTIVRANGLPAPIPDGEIDNVRAFATAVAAAQVEPELQPLVDAGSWVRVRGGAFKDVVGQAIERRGKKRMLVGLHAVGQGMEVDIDTRLLRVIPPPAWATAARPPAPR